MKSIASSGCLLVATLPFAAIGLYFGYLAVDALLTWRESRRWAEVRAEILETHFDVQESEDGFAYRARAKYRYSFDGVDHEGERISLLDQGDSWSFHQVTYARLEEARKGNRPVPCFVNPERPEESILVRDPRWGLVAFLLGASLAFVSPSLFVVLIGSYVDRLKAATRRGDREATRRAGETR
jgi:Protein of unknown function (DUF3592)